MNKKETVQFPVKKIIIIILMSIVILALYFFVYKNHFNLSQSNFSSKKSDVSLPLRVYFFDIGQGDATFIEFPNGEQMLIDCAVDARILEALGRTMSFYDREIDYLVVTHPDMDHYGGCIDLLHRFRIKTLIYDGFEKNESEYWRFFMDTLRSFEASGLNFIQADSEFSWDRGGTRVDFLFPDRDILIQGPPKGVDPSSGNNASIVIKMTYGSQDFLFMADAEYELEQYLLEKYGDRLEVEVLKVGHHGSDTSSSQNFLDQVNPTYAIISSGEDNKYGHPSKRVLKRLERKGATIWRTDREGDILMSVYHDTIEMYAKK
ncbi:MAG: MBL fold metallo-hydrolase [Candidatus Magasanikbacteria bacterium]|nr:MBL fold metallo-hydrolase [Candidatus Magasanikbacteria bacterium]